MTNAIERIALNEDELFDVNGGNWFTDACGKAWNATCDWVDEHRREIVIGATIVGTCALCVTGLGVAALAGAVAVEGVGGLVATGTILGVAAGGPTAALVVEETGLND